MSFPKNPNQIPEECIAAVKQCEIVITDIESNKVYSMRLTILASLEVNAELFVIMEKKNDKDFS